MLVVSLLIISAVAWYAYPAFTKASDSYVYNRVYSFEELFCNQDAEMLPVNTVVIGSFGERIDSSWAHHDYWYDPLSRRLITRQPEVVLPPGHDLVSQTYNFYVDQYILGQGEDTIKVRLPVRWQDAGVRHAAFISPEPSERVVIFLFTSDYIDYHWPAREPYRFRLENGYLHVESNFPDIRTSFSPINLDELMEMTGE